MNKELLMNLFITLPINKKKRDNKAFIVIIFSLLLILTILVDPRDISILACQLKNSTGYSCATCGLSRSFYAVAHFDITEAFRYHLLGPIFYLLILGLFIKSSIELMSKKEIKILTSPKSAKILMIILAFVWLVYWTYNFYKGI